MLFACIIGHCQYMHDGESMVVGEAISVRVLIISCASIATIGDNKFIVISTDQFIPKLFLSTISDQLLMIHRGIRRSDHGFNAMTTLSCIDSFVVSEVLG